MAASRTKAIKDEIGDRLTATLQKCCTEVCPEEIHITDNAIIPLKERVVDEFYEPDPAAGAKDTRERPKSD